MDFGAKLPNSDLKLAVDFGVYFCSCFSKENGLPPQKKHHQIILGKFTRTLVQKNSRFLTNFSQNPRLVNWFLASPWGQLQYYTGPIRHKKEYIYIYICTYVVELKLVQVCPFVLKIGPFFCFWKSRSQEEENNTKKRPKHCVKNTTFNQL